MNPLSEVARAIVADALAQVDVRHAMRAALKVEDGRLILPGVTVPLTNVEEIFLIAVGKAALPMYVSAREALRGAPHIRQRAVVVGPPGSAAPEGGAAFFAAGHPLPNAVSGQASEAALGLLQQASTHTVVLFLLSGGASAMLEKPLDADLRTADLADFHRILVASGLPIQAMNTLRKHLSAVKGGRLAAASARARAQITLLVSDVEPTMPELVGSGPSLPDPSTLADCRTVLDRLAMRHSLPPAILKFFYDPKCPETPKPGHPAFVNAVWRTVLCSDDLALAALAGARARGFHAEIDNTCDDWEYRDAGQYLLDRSRALGTIHGAACLISVGEVSLWLPEDHGRGGRNGHFALWCANKVAKENDTATILSAATDGVDGNSTTAGAVCDETTWGQAAAAGFSIDYALSAFDTEPLLLSTGQSLAGGATGQNLRDLRLILRDRRQDSS